MPFLSITNYLLTLLPFYPPCLIQNMCVGVKKTRNSSSSPKDKNQPVKSLYQPMIQGLKPTFKNSENQPCFSGECSADWRERLTYLLSKQREQDGNSAMLVNEDCSEGEKVCMRVGPDHVWVLA